MFGMISLKTNCDAEDFQEALEELKQLRLRQERQRQLEEQRKKLEELRKAEE